MLTPRLAPLSILATTVLMLSSCAELTIKQDLDPQLTEIQDLQLDLQSEWSDIEALVASIEVDVQEFSAHPLDEDTFDSPEVIDAIVTSVDDQLRDQQVTAAAETAATGADASVSAAGAEVSGLASELLESSASIAARLGDEFPDAITSVVEKAGGAALQLAKVREAAERKLAISRKNPLMTAEDNTALEAEHQELDQRLAEFEAYVDQLSTDADGLRDRVVAASQMFQAKLDEIEALQE